MEQAQVTVTTQPAADTLGVRQIVSDALLQELHPDEIWAGLTSLGDLAAVDRTLLKREFDEAIAEFKRQEGYVPSWHSEGFWH